MCSLRGPRTRTKMQFWRVSFAGWHHKHVCVQFSWVKSHTNNTDSKWRHPIKNVHFGDHLFFAHVASSSEKELWQQKVLNRTWFDYHDPFFSRFLDLSGLHNLILHLFKSLWITCTMGKLLFQNFWNKCVFLSQKTSENYYFKLWKSTSDKLRRQRNNQMFLWKL